MKALAEVWDFITGGSLVAPAAVVIAVGFALLPLGLAGPLKAAIFLAIVLLGFVGSAFERPR